jgi:hypothetical protein
MIIIGPENGPLPFDVSEALWAVWATCCGTQATIVDVEYAAGMSHEGNPLGGVHTTMPTCRDDDVLMLAAITFAFPRTDPGVYLMVAGAAGPLVDCDAEVQSLMDLNVEVTVNSTQTPTEQPSWGALKILYR